MKRMTTVLMSLFLGTACASAADLPTYRQYFAKPRAEQKLVKDVRAESLAHARYYYVEPVDSLYYGPNSNCTTARVAFPACPSAGN